MAVSDAVLRNLTTIYVAVIALIKAYGVASGRSCCFSGWFVLIASTVVVCLILILTVTWDLSRKATYAISRGGDAGGGVGGGGGGDVPEICRGGICWHGVSVRSSTSQVRFKLPEQLFSYGGAS